MAWRGGVPDREAIDAVLFDAGGVLILPDASAGRSALRSLGCESSDEDWRRAHYQANLAFDRMDVPDWPAIRRTVASAVGVSDDRLEEAIPLIEALIVSTRWVAVDGAAEAISSLGAAGYQVAIVSNAFGTVERDLEELRICAVSAQGVPRVAAVIDSHVVGFEKPDPRIFELALDVLNVEPSRALYVGDTIKADVRGAEVAGLHPVHMDPFGFCDESHHHIAALSDLVSWLA